jgi:hypothetical protein
MKTIYLTLTAALALSVTFGMARPAMAQSSSGFVAVPAANMNASTRLDFEVFKPKKRTDKRRLDYQVWDDILQNIVVDFGVSSRIRSTRPAQGTGSRIVSGHTSPYRLEGSRILFGFLNDTYRNVLTEYREDLVKVANQLDITRLSKDEQLAFWFNLHNVALIEQIARYYPEGEPSTLEINVEGVTGLIDDAKFIKIGDQSLSLRNIREDIVFANWSDPIVLYGFFRGDIGSPKMLRFAYSADSLEYQLNGTANEFVNSLRGFHEARKARKVSKIYDEARPYYFPNWETDIAAHIKRFAEGETLEDFNADKPFEFDEYETKIADLSGGHRRASGLFVEGSGNLPPETARLLSEVGQKQEILRRRGIFMGSNRGFVIIEDIETDPDQVPGETIK